MQSSNLYTLIRSFSSYEIKDLRRFLASPYFNLRSDVITLFEALVRSENPGKHKSGPTSIPINPSTTRSYACS